MVRALHETVPERVRRVCGAATAQGKVIGVSRSVLWIGAGILLMAAVIVAVGLVVGGTAYEAFEYYADRIWQAMGD